ncbi:anti-sigma factor [Nocardioides marmoriginsengisoli]|uniref:Anti-sigma factor n=1 Tax=Nocardioides marmoriginsengisoli TaxID=661483 RepID=A0A3N0CPB1_9ACTN|nr:ATP-binding protein [Nocardioides marmoriginsengisoli]RNL65285.1 anti-sigma factor [Nocardioides marmoriginsengisoli]
MHPDAEVRLPAETAYVAVLRMAAAGIAARLDFTLDDVEDLRMAVGEACAMVLADADPGGSLTARFFLGDGRVEVQVSADAKDPAAPDPDSFAWQVLTTTAEDVSAAATADRISITLAVSSATSSAPA